MKIKQQLNKVWKKIRIVKETVTPQISPTICAVPWMHLNFEPNGKVVPCCLTSHHNYFSGDLNTQTIEEIWNSPNQRELRRDMMAGREPKICETCFNKEHITGESSRIHRNREFPEVLKAIPNITTPDGTCTSMELKYWDFRFSNLCNFKCRSCGPRYSSSWVPEAKKLGYHIDKEKVSSIEQVEGQNNYDFLSDQVKHVKRIYFAGGEPLLMPEHWQTLDILAKNKRFDVRLSYNTNCSTLTYQGQNVLDYWQQWNHQHVEIWPSIDEIGDRAELIRSGTNWPKVEDNLKMLANLNYLRIRLGITVGAWNVNRLPEIITYLVNLKVINAGENYTNFYLNIIYEPIHYHVNILNDQYRADTIEKIKNFIKEYNKEYNTIIDDKFVQILYELEKPFNVAANTKFKMNTQQLDLIRSENIYITIPELKEATSIE